MASVIVTTKIMPTSPEVDLVELENKCLEVIKTIAIGQTKTEKEPVAFGLSALKIYFVMDEKLGSPDIIEDKMAAIEGIQSFQVVDCRRTIG